ncbi:hypothetical protein HLV37_04220 [Eggerthellaceae bacterium zg-1084]|uniref:Uncharacterized protein n=1 Tax=Berryella wangjianweii TaxID=2734634 RepID=A0A6M8J785_9ACTN|nr:hypothetical protein [Berryella wangjianweii]NPD31070.1 hypothetical protein [Berryella wangjianweii]QKF07478.1 hypothetical protein HLV38_04600 [Berryella wangjianweii]
MSKKRAKQAAKAARPAREQTDADVRQTTGAKVARVFWWVGLIALSAVVVRAVVYGIDVWTQATIFVGAGALSLFLALRERDFQGRKLAARTKSLGYAAGVMALGTAAYLAVRELVQKGF